MDEEQTHFEHQQITDVLRWSPKCHEHFLPWRSAAAAPMPASTHPSRATTRTGPSRRMPGGSPHSGAKR